MSNQALVTPSSVVLVSGGARGITAQCVIRLAERSHCQFILLGRTPLEAVEAEWSKELHDEAGLKRAIMEHLATDGNKPSPQKVQKVYREIVAQREIRDTLQAVQAAGGQAEYVRVDVTDAPALQEKVSQASARLGQVTGVIHAAGNLADKMIEKKSEQDFAAVFSPKVDGLKNLLSAVAVDQLGFLVLFSSVAGFYGNVGQADYAIANEVLNKTAHKIKHRYPNLHVIAIDWGPWDGGMVTPELKKAFAERDIVVIPVETGAEMLVNELAPVKPAPAQVVVGSPLSRQPGALAPDLQTYHIRRRLSLEANPFLQDHRIGGKPVLPATCAASWIIHSSEQLYPGFTFSSLDDYRVLKGIVFDDTLADEYVLDLKETSKSIEEGIHFEAMIWSKNQRGRSLYHYTMRLRLLRNLPPAPLVSLGDFAPLPGSQPRAGQEFYRDGTLFHGPSFQGVDQVVRVDDAGVLMRCRLPALEERAQGQFPVQTTNPYLLDAIVQCLLIWSQSYYHAPCLPSSLEAFEQFRPMQFGQNLYVSMHVRSHSHTSVVGDIRVQDQSGRLFVRIQGLEGTISEHLGHLLANNGNRN